MVECGIETDVLSQSMCMPTELQKRGVCEMMHSPVLVLASLLDRVNMGEVLYFGAVSRGPASLWQGLVRVRGLSPT